MNSFICEHPDVVSYSIGLLIAILGGAASLIIYFLKIKIARLTSIEDKIDLIVKNYEACRESLPVRFSTKMDVTHICEKIDKIDEKMSSFAYIYRTKEEAQREWRMMETRLTSMESTIKANGESAAERHREVWDKLNRVVDMFRDEATKMEARINAVSTQSNQNHWQEKNL